MEVVISAGLGVLLVGFLVFNARHRRQSGGVDTTGTTDAEAGI